MCGGDVDEKVTENSEIMPVKKSSILIKDEIKKLIEEEDKEIEIINEGLAKLYEQCGPLDVTGSIPMSFNLEQLLRQGFHPTTIENLLVECYEARTLKLFDYLGEYGMYWHYNTDIANKNYDICFAADFAVAHYNELVDEDKKLKSMKIDKCNVLLLCMDTAYYLTLTAQLQNNVEKTYQAIVVSTEIHSEIEVCLLGMLRDVDDNKVLAVLQIQQGPKEDTRVGGFTSAGST